MKLKKGSNAIDFTIQDIFGNNIKLSDYKGKKIYLTFMRHVKCPFCNVRVHRLMGKRLALEQSGVKVISFFESSPEVIKSSVLHQGLMPWPLIGDLEKKIYKIYGVEESVIKMMKTIFAAKNMGETSSLSKKLDTAKQEDKTHSHTLIPADFFINEDFTIERAYYGAHSDDHIEIDEILKFAGVKIY